MCLPSPSVSAPAAPAPLPTPPPIADNFQAAPVINDGTGASADPGRLGSLAQLSLLHGGYKGSPGIATDQLKLGQHVTSYGADGTPVYSAPTPPAPAPRPAQVITGYDHNGRPVYGTPTPVYQIPGGRI